MRSGRGQPESTRTDGDWRPTRSCTLQEWVSRIHPSPVSWASSRYGCTTVTHLTPAEPRPAPTQSSRSSPAPTRRRPSRDHGRPTERVGRGPAPRPTRHRGTPQPGQNATTDPDSASHVVKSGQSWSQGNRSSEQVGQGGPGGLSSISGALVRAIPAHPRRPSGVISLADTAVSRLPGGTPQLRRGRGRPPGGRLVDTSGTHTRDQERTEVSAQRTRARSGSNRGISNFRSPTGSPWSGPTCF